MQARNEGRDHFSTPKMISHKNSSSHFLLHSFFPANPRHATAGLELVPNCAGRTPLSTPIFPRTIASINPYISSYSPRLKYTVTYPRMLPYTQSNVRVPGLHGVHHAQLVHLLAALQKSRKSMVPPCCKVCRMLSVLGHHFTYLQVGVRAETWSQRFAWREAVQTCSSVQARLVQQGV